MRPIGLLRGHRNCFGDRTVLQDMMRLRCCVYFSAVVMILLEAWEASSIVATCANPRLLSGSQEYFEQGELLVANNRASDSVPFFRTAARMCPSSGRYWQRLAEAEFLAELYQKSWQRILKARSLGTDDVDLEALNQLSMRDEYSPFRVSTSSPTLVKGLFPELTVDDSFANHLNHPFVIRNAFVIDDNLATLSDIQSLKSNHGDSLVEFYPQNMQSKPEKVYTATMTEALDYFDYPDGAYVSCDVSEVGAYVQWNINVSTFHRLTQGSSLPLIVQSTKSHLDHFLSTVASRSAAPVVNSSTVENLKESFAKKTHWYMLLAGEESAGMFMHTDNLPVGSWQLQLHGDKRWTVCPPLVAGEDLPQCRELMNGVCMEHEMCVETNLHAGDLLYYPPLYWHQTMCLTNPTLSFSGTVIGDHVEFAKAIEQECRHRKYGYNFDQRLCEILLSKP
jgi:hypothetical protein